MFMNNKCFKLFYISFLFLLFLFISSFGVSFGANSVHGKNLPKYVINRAEQRFNGSDKIKIVFIMNWHGYKVFQVIKKEKGIVFDNPRYWLFKNGKFYKYNIKEYNQLCLDVRLHQNKEIIKNNKELTKKLLPNEYKIMEIDENMQSVDIQVTLREYAKKYMIKNQEANFLYLLEWNGQHVYRAYWPKYGFLLNRLAVILYDGHIIRRPTKEEFDELLPKMRKAYEEYLNELTHLHNKD